MTVAELIAELQKHPQDYQVGFTVKSPDSFETEVKLDERENEGFFDGLATKTLWMGFVTQDGYSITENIFD